MTIRLEGLGPRHADAIFAGQDPVLAAEIVGERWTGASLDAFLTRAAGWRADGPVREFAAMRAGAARGAEYDAGGDDGRRDDVLVGGGGLNLLDPCLERGQAALTYWILAEHRGRGHGHDLAAALVEHARAESRISQVVLRIAPTNAASRALARALGARPTGERERHPADAARLVDRWVLELRTA